MAEMQAPANAASVALIEGERVLLIQRAYPPYQHLWTLPGGTAEPGEDAEACARREIGEELGLRLGGLSHLETQELRSARAEWRLAVFACREFTGAITPSDEIEDHRWIGLAELGGLRTTAQLDSVLKRAFALVARR